MKAKERIIVALDGMDDVEAMVLAGKLEGKVRGFKIADPFIPWGLEILDELKKFGKIFLDLKFFDSPKTVRNHVKGLVGLEHRCGINFTESEPLIDMFTVHALGTSEMIKAAAEELLKVKNPPITLGVTIPTNLDEKTILKEWGVDRPLEDMIYDLAFFATRAGCRGIVCSAHEASLVKEVCPEDTIIVTPGIKPAFTVENYDQKRVATPSEAIKAGAGYLVIGRAITQAPDPVEAVERITQEIEEADS